MDQKQITGRLISRNWVINLVGQGLPLLIGVVTIPWLLRYLGVERFGILSITWTLLGYAGQFDLGLGRATTKYVAECLGRGDTRSLPGLFWTSLLTQMTFGVVVALLLSAITPALVDKILKISPAQLAETKSVLLILAASLPVVVASNSLRGMLEAGQQFGVINYIKIPANASVFLFPVLGIPLGIRLPGIVLLLVAARFASAIAFLGFCFKFFPVLRSRFVFDAKLVRPLFIYGGWVTVSNLIGPLLMRVDQFFIGAMLSVAAVGYYTAPYEIATKIWLIPTSLLATIFPAFSSLHASESHARMEELYSRSLKSILLVSGPVLLVLAAFSRQLLNAWLGPDFAAKSATTLQVLALAVLINCIAFVPFGLLQGLGRPDLTAKFHLLETPFYALALWFFLPRFGLVGAAWAWVLRISLDTTLLFLAVLKLKFISPSAMIEKPLKRALLALVLPAVLLPLSWVNTSFAAQLALSSLILVVFVTAVWGYVLDHNERNLLLSALAFRSRMARAK
ncbi:MAG TPA: flippase [Candidatus Angelobacter sp.]|jgi:O-antigen/teichoic acid export membrane protein|nr:flippase [Candidatus Angelobacter sp.]